MKITAKFCLLHLLIWHQVNGSIISSVTFKKTSLNLSLLKNIQHRLVYDPVYDSASLVTCGLECSLDATCHGFGYRKLPNKECLLIRITESNETNQSNPEGFEYYLLKDLPSHCGQVTNKESGLALLDIGVGQLIVGYCEQKVGTGGFLVLQQRFDGSENFYRNWDSYKVGFGKPWGEFWIGNDNLHQLTKDGNSKLLIELEDKSGVKISVKYKTFIVESEAMKYRLDVKDYEGGDPPGDSFGHQNGMYFTTYDSDNDNKNGENCAVTFQGAWWYRSCHQTNLNGIYGSDEYGKGINWKLWRGFNHSLPYVRMLLKKKQGI